MIPRTVQMAKEVAAQFNAAQLDDYGNVILNGYLSVVPNDTGEKAWQYAETNTAPVDLPSLTEVRPAMKGWTTNYAEYYTQLHPNSYNQDPGSPTMFEYTVHSFTPFKSTIQSINLLNGGGNYFPYGTYSSLPTTTSGTGTGALVDVVVNPVTERVISITLVDPGTGYAAGDTLVPVIPSYRGSGASAIVTAVDLQNPEKGPEPKWSQPPRRLISNGDKAIAYSAILFPSSM